MNSKLILFSLVLLGCFMTQKAEAQLRKLRSLSSEIEMTNEDDPSNYERWKITIDGIMSNPETSEDPLAYGWRAIVYNRIYTSADTNINKIVPGYEAAKIAGESAVKFFQAPISRQNDYNTRSNILREVPNMIISCYNLGNSLKYLPGSFKTVESLMTVVEKLMDSDTAASNIVTTNGVNKDLATMAIWQAAYTDSLEDQEIKYLEKLSNLPRFFNANVYVRLAQIYSSKKQYDKALEYLTKGMEKIPQKSSTFIQQQINIEMERGNQEAIISKFNTAIANEPENATYYFSRGVTYHQLKLADIKKVDASGKTGTKIAPKYYFSQALADYNKCLELESGNADALYNMAILYRDSADVLYKEFKRIPPGSTNYDAMSAKVNAVYKATLEKLEAIRQGGQVKDAELVYLLEDMRACARRIGDIENSKKYEAMIKEEKARLNMNK